MNEEQTGHLGGNRSFEERVFARFDSMDARFDSMDSRFDAIDVWRSAADSRFDRIERRLGGLEVTTEKRALETKPIWERALNEILEVKRAVVELSRKVGILNREILTVKAEQERLDERLDEIESKRT